jgi:type II secretory pathway pseudopilin PulG
MRRWPASAEKGGHAGFTLLEMVGIMAILAILAAVILTTTSRSIDFAAANIESTNLVNFATALQNGVQRNRYIPGATGSGNWIQFIAAELGVNPFQVTTNARNLRRVMMVDANNTMTLPYTETNTGTGSILPPALRMMILSTIGPPFPTSFTDGTTNDFNTIWNTPDGTLPTFSNSNPLSSWAGTGDDFKVQRLNLGSLFTHLVLWNYPPPNAPQGQYQIDYQALTNQVPTNGVNTYFIKGTILTLLNNQSPAVPQIDQILSRDSTFFYIQQVWRGTLDLGQGLGQGGTNISQSTLAGATFGATAAAFVGSPYNTKATAGTTPPIVVNAMSNFMNSYVGWASTGFSNSSLRLSAYSDQMNLLALLNNLQNGLPNAGGCTNGP